MPCPGIEPWTFLVAAANPPKITNAPVGEKVFHTEAILDSVQIRSSAVKWSNLGKLHSVIIRPIAVKRSNLGRGTSNFLEISLFFVQTPSN